MFSSFQASVVFELLGVIIGTGARSSKKHSKKGQEDEVERMSGQYGWLRNLAQQQANGSKINPGFSSQ